MENFIIWQIEKGIFRPPLTAEEIISLSKELSLHCGSNLSFLTCSKHRTHMNARNTMSLYFDIFYQMNLQVSFHNNIGDHINGYSDPKYQICDISSVDFFHNELDECSRYLNEGINDIKNKKFLDGFPKLVMWLDKYVQKDSSGFCALRDSCIHPDLFEKSKNVLKKNYPNELEFESDGSLMRNSGKNVEFLKSKVPHVLKEIAPHFQKRYFGDNLLPQLKRPGSEFPR